MFDLSARAVVLQELATDVLLDPVLTEEIAQPAKSSGAAYKGCEYHADYFKRDVINGGVEVTLVLSNQPVLQHSA